MRVNIKSPAAIKDEHTIRNNPDIQQIAQMTPQEVGAYIETNVTNLASTKRVLKWLAMICVWLVRRELKQ